MKVFGIISTFFTITLLFIASDVVLQFGTYGSLILCASFFTASLFIYLFRNRLFHTESNLHRTILLYLTLFIFLLEMFVLHSWVISSIVSYVDDRRLHLILLGIFIMIPLILVLVKKTSDLFVNTSILVNLLLIFIMAILLPNFIYLQKGLETVYHNLIHYHPKLLHSSREGLWGLFIALTIVFFVKIYIVLFLHSIHSEKIKSYLLLISLCAGSIMLAFSTMILVAVTERVEAVHPNVLILSLLDKLMNSYIFTFIWIAIIICSLISLQLSLLFVKRKIASLSFEINKSYFPYWLLLFLCASIFQFYFLRDVYILDMLMFFMIWQIPLVLILLGSISRRNLLWILCVYLNSVILFGCFDFTLATQVIMATGLTSFFLLLSTILHKK